MSLDQPQPKKKGITHQEFLGIKRFRLHHHHHHALWRPALIHFLEAVTTNPNQLPPASKCQYGGTVRTRHPSRNARLPRRLLVKFHHRRLHEHWDRCTIQRDWFRNRTTRLTRKLALIVHHTNQQDFFDRILRQLPRFVDREVTLPPPPEEPCRCISRNEVGPASQSNPINATATSFIHPIPINRVNVIGNPKNNSNAETHSKHQPRPAEMTRRPL